MKPSDFTIKFDKIIEDLSKTQRDDIPGYAKLLNIFDANRRKAIQAIVQNNHKTWQSIMGNGKMNANEKREQFSQLNDTVSGATKAVCDLIISNQVKAREQVDKLDNSDLIASIMKQVQNAIDEQETAAGVLVEMGNTLKKDIEKIYEKNVGVFKEIYARVNSKS